MAQLTTRLPEQLKRQMEKMRDLNWSEIIREAIRASIHFKMKKRRFRNKRLVNQAVKKQNEIAEALSSRYDGSWSGVEVIRYWRNHRYSSSTPQ
jgi:Arc/MetJ-type ribon-helix-helix transcriptional regulator